MGVLGMKVIIFIVLDGGASRAFLIPEDWNTDDVERFITGHGADWDIATTATLESVE